MKILKYSPNIVFGCIINFILCLQANAHIFSSAEPDYDKELLTKDLTIGFKSRGSKCMTFIDRQSDEFKGNLQKIMEDEDADYHSCSVNSCSLTETPDSFEDNTYKVIQGKGDHIILKTRGKNKYIILSFFPSNIFASRLSINDNVSIPVKSNRYFSNWFFSVSPIRTVSYTYNIMGNYGIITDSVTSNSRGYHGTDSHGVAVKVRIPLDEWFAYSIESDSAGMIKDRQFAPSLSNYAHKCYSLLDYIIEPISAFFRDGYIEAVVKSPIAHAALLLLIINHRQASLNAVISATKITGRALQVTSSGGVFLLGKALTTANSMVYSSPITSVLNTFYLWNSGLVSTATGYLSSLLNTNTE
ncbi:MAG: hypothetical protein QS748_02215 [Candidatus Endonucleobacter bathymodioli]|uniref:Uncharacterized protein n=1 Tax=Candidatus Endonucleibacter bathymodioli TaxID=539814 RepID=A0AA90NJW2_9GAMM|nr:hypothetical protein [Candidatus Endonucleobacter bathymodioli]